MKSFIQFLLLSSIFFYSCNSVCFAQNRVNELSVGLASVYFPDWKFSGSWSAGGHYQRTLKEPFSLAFGFQYGYGSIASDFDFTAPANLGTTLDRSLYHADLAVGYKFLTNTSSTISLGLYSGLTYVWGREVIFLIYYPSPPAPFPEAFYVSNPRHHLGFITGIELNFLLLKRFNVEPNVKFRAYTKGVPDLSFGINLGFRFADPKFIRKDT